MKYFILAKFSKHLNLQICKYWYIFAVGSKQLKTHRSPKTHKVGWAFLQQRKKTF